MLYIINSSDLNRNNTKSPNYLTTKAFEDYSENCTLIVPNFVYYGFFVSKLYSYDQKCLW